jgi:hypothetical protein
MEPNQGMPLGVPMSADHRRRGGLQAEPQPVGALAIAASVMVGLVVVVAVVEAVSGLRGQLTVQAVAALVHLAALITAGVVFVAWLWRARTNVDITAGRHTQRLGKGWAIGSWVVPIGNLRLPYRFVLDVWRASAPSPDPGRGLVLAWWLAFLAGRVITQFAALGRTVDQPAVAVGNLCEVAAAVLVVLVVRQITEWQSLPSS